jgi:hypothetical protein
LKLNLFDWRRRVRKWHDDQGKEAAEKAAEKETPSTCREPAGRECFLSWPLAVEKRTKQNHGGLMRRKCVWQTVSSLG